MGQRDDIRGWLDNNPTTTPVYHQQSREGDSGGGETKFEKIFDLEVKTLLIYLYIHYIYSYNEVCNNQVLNDKKTVEASCDDTNSDVNDVWNARQIMDETVTDETTGTTENEEVIN